MSSHQYPYSYLDHGPMYQESDTEPTVTRRLSRTGFSDPQAATGDGGSGQFQPHSPIDEIADTSVPLGQFEIYSRGNMNRYSYPDDFQPVSSLQHIGVETDATYPVNDFQSLFANLPLGERPGFNYGEPPHQFPFTQQTAYGHPQSLTDDAYQMHYYHPVDVQNPPAPYYQQPSSSHLPSLGDGRHVGVPDSLVLDGVNTGTVELPNMCTSQYSHAAPVADAPSNQVLAPSGPQPSSPEAARLSPLSPADDASTARRVPRAQSVQPVSSDMNSRSRSEIPGRGPSIPQERYTTTSILSYKKPNQYPPITFNLTNPDQIGIPVSDILGNTEAFARIRDGKEVFDMGKKTFTLRIQWPGYQSWSKTIAAMNWKKERGPISRQKLAEAVATGVHDLITKYRDTPCDSDCTQWNVGPSGIQIDQICLLELHRVSKGSWQPVLCLLEPRH